MLRSRRWKVTSHRSPRSSVWYSFRHLHFDQLQPGFSDHPGPGEVGHKLTSRGLGGDAVRLEHWA